MPTRLKLNARYKAKVVAKVVAKAKVARVLVAKADTERGRSFCATMILL
jgi:hypothetical protein